MSVENLRGEVQTVLFHNPETGYVVLRLKASDQPGLVTVVGGLGNVVPGEGLLVSGHWQEHPKFGRQFQAQSWEQMVPASLNGIKRYLGSGMIKGLGPSLAQRLVDAFGTEVLDLLDQDPERLLEVEGIGPKKLERMVQSWAAQREIRSLMLFLQTHEVPTTYAGRIFKHYGANAVHKLTQNPYDLAYEIRGIGFKTADKMALKLGFSLDSPQRLEALLIYTLFQHSEAGHLFCPRHELMDKVYKVGDHVPAEGLDQALARLEEKKRIRVVDLPEQDVQQAVFLHHFYRWEKEIAARLGDLSSHPSAVDEAKVRTQITRLTRSSKLEFSAEQLEAMEKACLHKTAIITGGPGTGKTTLTTIIVTVLRRLQMKVLLAAPTGRAAKRLAEATGSWAQTLHRMLGFSPGEGFAHNEDKKLKADAVLVDEASMLDCQLFVHLLRALPLTCKLILVGDVHQLPSVGPGHILADLINSQALPTTVLTHIFRQAQESMVVVNAHRINQGKFPQASPLAPPQADFFWVQQDDVQKVQELILYMVCERIPKIYRLDPVREVQVLTPMHKGLVGTQELNARLQEMLNPSGREVRSGNRAFRIGDRVLQTRNNYDKEVFNGDLGWVRGFDQDEGELIVEFDDVRVRYTQNEFDELSLAYCISVHKSQGSEYPAVIVPVVTQHYLLLQRNLIYTALTRAKRLAVLVGSKKALGLGLNNISGSRRYTHLEHRLRETASRNDG
ncbi:SF1B family DNA helicase RecD2 [Desulfovermiculus halophilus]|uniref:SF1B family DNA helicase RecD2 n=1 Tax=Desulfovermiculus halophilus TaxID=339722 RepID=UPI00048345D2|nr:ATP-dependent RecD-like DNA helicase [Desulfovermiculus halophilus]